jgi:hypothetical protein
MISLVLIGQMRTWNNNKIINSYEKYLSKYGNIDLYIFTWNKIGYSNHHGEHNLNRYSEDILTEKEVHEYYKQYKFINLKYIHIENFEEFIKNLDNRLLNIYNTAFRNHSQFSTCVPIQYKYQQSMRYLKKIEDITKYSNMIITRPDMCFIDDLPEINTKEDIIYYNCNCVRCFDHCWYGKPMTIIKHLYFAFDNFFENYNTLPKINELNRDNNELLHLECNKNNIKLNVNQKQMVEIIYFS